MFNLSISPDSPTHHKVPLHHLQYHVIFLCLDICLTNLTIFLSPISDEELQEMSTSRTLSRLPVISWCDFGACALVLFCCHQIFMLNLLEILFKDSFISL